MLAKQSSQNKGNWIIGEIEGPEVKELVFVLKEPDAFIKSFSITCDKETNWPMLNVVCTDDGKVIIQSSSYLNEGGSITFIPNFEDSTESFNEYTVTDPEEIISTVLSISESFYISREQKRLVSKNFNSLPPFPNDRSAVDTLVVHFANVLGFEAGYEYAKKELETNNESSCMDILAEHNISFEEKIRAREVHRYGEHSLFWQAAKVVIRNNINADNAPMEVSEVLNVAKKFA
jgi:hypothetical protein